MVIADNATYLKSNINFKLVKNITFVKAKKMNVYLCDANKISAINLTELANNWLHKNEFPLFQKRKNEIAKKEYIASRFVIKKILSSYTSYNYHELYVQFNHQEDKLQVYNNDKKLPFSLCISHSNGVVLIALGHNEISLGVDIEKIKVSRDYQALAASYYHIDEQSLIETHGINAFYRLWTLKEALSKTLREPMTALLKEKTLTQLSPYYVNSGIYHDFDLSIITSNSDNPLDTLIVSVLDLTHLTVQANS